MIVLGLDYGTVRIGVALSDFSGTIAHPKTFIAAEPLSECLAQIVAICSENDVSTIVLGLPKHMNGDEGVSAIAARKLGAAVAEATSLPVDYIDERLTTLAADKVLTECEVKGPGKKDRIDSVAAAIILQNYLDMRAISN
jgi:putative Holliday junction resolvase